ncbi:ring finger, partial [Moniliophthora roreri]
QHPHSISSPISSSGSGTASSLVLCPGGIGKPCSSSTNFRTSHSLSRSNSSSANAGAFPLAERRCKPFLVT